MSSMTWFIYALALVPNSAGQPAGGNERIRRDVPHDLDIIVYDAEVTSATRVREAVEWVDEAGKLVGIATEDVLLLPTSLAPRTLLNETEAKDVTTPQCTKTLLLPPNKGPSSEIRHDRISAPARLNELMTASNIASSGTTEATEHTETPSASSDGKKAASRRFGVSYTPYRADQGCKSQGDIDNDFKRMAGSYFIIRIYGTDCNQVSMVYSAAKAHGMKLFLGIWNPSSLQEEANKIIAAINGDWDVVDTVSIGNELVNNGKASPPELMSFVSQARSVLRAAGYDGPVVAVDTFTAVLAHPKLCDESDYCTINPMLSSTELSYHRNLEDGCITPYPASDPPSPTGIRKLSSLRLAGQQRAHPMEWLFQAYGTKKMLCNPSKSSSVAAQRASFCSLLSTTYGRKKKWKHSTLISSGALKAQSRPVMST
ncbi:hypothetical protein E4U59_000993 [Claviceps monticola]|nr:hypothetical protein E4U59_000993 [Claviceps monticola]